MRKMRKEKKTINLGLPSHGSYGDWLGVAETMVRVVGCWENVTMGLLMLDGDTVGAMCIGEGMPAGQKWSGERLRKTAALGSSGSQRRN